MEVSVKSGEDQADHDRPSSSLPLSALDDTFGLHPRHASHPTDNDDLPRKVWLQHLKIFITPVRSIHPLLVHSVKRQDSP